MRLLLALLAALLLAGLAARPAAAEEMFVLDNGTILQGTVMKEADGVVHLRLTGIGTDSRVEVRREKIAKRFTTMDPSRRRLPDDVRPAETPAEAAGDVVAPPPPPAQVPLPAEEPTPSEETFFQRFLRLAALAFPSEGPARVFLAILGFVVVLCLVTLGGRVSDLEGLTLGRSTALALAFYACIVADVVWSPTLLRADRGAWVIPVQLAAWVGLAAVTLRCGLSRAVSLLAFVVFTGAIVAFASGALLVTV